MHVTAKTDIGLVRTENEDTVLVRNLDGDSVIAILCDGMGGMNAGGEASKIASEEIDRRIASSYRSNADENSIRNMIISAINAANIIIYEKSLHEENKEGMGTTCVCGIVKKNIAYIANVGDSRAYVITKDEIRQITTDHTIVKMLMDQGKINADEAKTHPQKNVITRAVGIDERLEIDYYEVEIKPDTKILFCSDGLSGYCDEGEIFRTVNENSPEDTTSLLIELAKKNGGKDNITVAIASN